MGRMVRSFPTQNISCGHDPLHTIMLALGADRLRVPHRQNQRIEGMIARFTHVFKYGHNVILGYKL